MQIQRLDDFIIFILLFGIALIVSIGVGCLVFGFTEKKPILTVIGIIIVCGYLYLIS